MTSKVFFTMLHIQLGLPHPSALGLSYYICGQPLDLMGFTFFDVFVVGRGWLPMMLCSMFLHLLWGMQDFIFYVNRLTFFHHILFGLCINGSTLWFWWMTYKHWSTLSSLSPLKQIWFHKQLYLMGLLLQLQLRLKMPFIIINTQ